MFFNFDVAELTPDDRAALDSYAAKYVAAGSTDPVKVEGWASVDGQPSRNLTLSKERAQAVADYLVSKGIPKDRVSWQGLGPTDKFGKTDLASNRRASISPKPPSGAAPATPVPPASTGPAPAPAPGPGGPNIDPSSPANQKALEDTIAQIDEANDWVRKRLTSNGLRPDPNISSGDMVQYKNKTTALTDVINETVNDGKNAPIKAPELITPDRVQRIAGQVLLEASPGGGKVGGKSALNISVYLQVPVHPGHPSHPHLRRARHQGPAGATGPVPDHRRTPRQGRIRDRSLRHCHRHVLRR